MSAPVKKCEVCDDTGHRYNSKFLDCTQCGAAVERIEFDSKIYSGEKMSIDDRLWLAYQLGKAAGPDSGSDAALAVSLLKNPQLLRLVKNMDEANHADDFGKRARKAFEELCEWIADFAAHHPHVASAPVVPVAAPNDKWRTMCHALSDIWNDSLKWHEDRSYDDDAWPEQIKELRAMVEADDADFLPVAAQPVVQAPMVTPDGWKLVPREMTEEHLREVTYNINRKYKGNPLGDEFTRLVWHWALYAAPSLEAQPAGEVERDAALKFSDHIINGAFDGGDWCGGDIQELAVEYGLLKPEAMNSACSNDGGCQCVRNGEGFPSTCYRKTYIAAMTQGEKA